MSAAHYENPFIVQSDHTVLVEVDRPRYVEGRDALARFAELVKSPEHVHTYRITPLSIWNACAAGVTVQWIRETLRGLSKYDVPRHVEIEIVEYASRPIAARAFRNCGSPVSPTAGQQVGRLPLSPSGVRAWVE